MSMTLILWKGPVLTDEKEAKRLLDRWYETGDDSAFEPSTDLAVVLEQLLQKYPFDPEADSPPWADGPELTDRLLDLSIRWGSDDRILADITALARIHELVLYDPQGPDIFLPTDPLPEPDEIRSATLGEWAKSIAIAAFLCALTYAAWQIPIGWIRWPALLVTGFLAAAGLFVVGCLAFARQILESGTRNSAKESGEA